MKTMSSLDGQFFQKRRWEADYPMQSPEGKMRTLVIEAGRLGMDFRLIDRSENEDGNLVLEEVFRDGFWLQQVPGTPEELPCAPEHVATVRVLLRALDQMADGLETVQTLFNLCVIQPQVRHGKGDWLRRYLPDLFRHHEKVFLQPREAVVASVLQE